MLAHGPVMLVSALCVVVAAMPTADGGRGRAIMEEYRRDMGHWLFLQDEIMVDHMVQHIGPNGMAVAGFFIDNAHYQDNSPSKEEQAGDPLFAAFQQIAQNQSWTEKYGMGHKLWTFGYGHDRELATNVGCEDTGSWKWQHACIVFWKTSPDGGTLGAHHTVWFGHDHSKGIVPSVDDLKIYLKERVTAEVVNESEDEL